MEIMKLEILKLLARNARFTTEEIATMLDKDIAEVETAIKELEKDGLLRGYKALIDWDKLDGAYVSAIIELKVVPTAGLGFEDVAKKIMKYNEVESVYLMSGVYDLNVVVKGKTLQDIAKFVAKELATIDSVTSTSTHFVMRRYKEMDVELLSSNEDDRGQIWI
jgi:DNA-binding Lrp family transcriptional regulator